MKVILCVLSLLVFFSVQSKAQKTFSSVLTNNLDGKIQVYYILNTTLEDTTNYTTFVRCYENTEEGAIQGSGSQGMMNDGGTQNNGDEMMTCEDLTDGEPLSYCCTNDDVDTCLNNGTTFNKTINGVPTAGQEYNCTISIAYGGTSPPPEDTDSFKVTSGIPPKPSEVDWVAFSSNMSLNIVVTTLDNGLGFGMCCDGLTYTVQVEDGNGDVIYNKTSSVRAVSVLLDSSDPDNYTITAWVTNEYGTSEPTVVVAEEVGFPTASPSTTPTNGTTNGTTSVPTDSTDTTTESTVEGGDTAPVGAIVGGVVGGLAVIAIVIAGGIVVALLLVKNAKTKGSMKVKVSPE